MSACCVLFFSGKLFCTKPNVFVFAKIPEREIDVWDAVFTKRLCQTHISDTSVSHVRIWFEFAFALCVSRLKFILELQLIEANNQFMLQVRRISTLCDGIVQAPLFGNPVWAENRADYRYSRGRHSARHQRYSQGSTCCNLEDTRLYIA